MKKKDLKDPSIVPSYKIEQSIYFIRDQKVMLDSDLAELYGIKTKVLIQAIKRNIERFPEDFMFQINAIEHKNLKSQIVTSSSWGGRRTLPYAFTEHGIAMLSSVLRSPQAISVNIQIIRAFIHSRHILSSQKELVKIVTELRSFILKYSSKTDREIQKIWKAIEHLKPRPEDERKIGFQINQ